jgi:hypothetical protein
MRIVIIAVSVLIGISCAGARASVNGAATGTDSVSVGALKKPRCVPSAGSSFVHGRPWHLLITLRPTGISQPGTSGVRNEYTAHQCTSIHPRT